MPNLKNPGFIDFDSIDLSQKTKETLKDQSLTHITMFGKETEIERCLDNNCSNYEFMTTILKIPLNVNLRKCSTLVEKIKNHSHSDAELYTVIEHKNTNNVTIYGVGTVLFNTSENKASDNPTLSSELEEAINLIKGKFKSHANSVLRNQYKEEV